MSNRQPIPVKTRHIAINKDARVYALSDAHGHLDVFEQSLEAIAIHYRQTPPIYGQKVYIATLGDMVDKGTDSRGVIDRLQQHNGRVINLMGNHEKYLIDFTNGPVKDTENMIAAWIQESLHWLTHGGNATLESYGVKIPADPRELFREANREICSPGLIKDMRTMRRSFLKKLKRNNHLAHFSGLGATITRGHFVFCHAQLLPEKPAHKHDLEEVIYGRDITKYHGLFYGGHVVVHGHSSRMQSQRRPYSISIDPQVHKYHQPLVFVLDSYRDATFLHGANMTSGPYSFPCGPEDAQGSYAANAGGFNGTARFSGKDSKPSRLSKEERKRMIEANLRKRATDAATLG